MVEHTGRTEPFDRAKHLTPVSFVNFKQAPENGIMRSYYVGGTTFYRFSGKEIRWDCPDIQETDLMAICAGFHSVAIINNPADPTIGHAYFVPRALPTTPEFLERHSLSPNADEATVARELIRESGIRAVYVGIAERLSSQIEPEVPRDPLLDEVTTYLGHFSSYEALVHALDRRVTQTPEEHHKKRDLIDRLLRAMNPSDIPNLTPQQQQGLMRWYTQLIISLKK